MLACKKIAIRWEFKKKDLKLHQTSQIRDVQHVRCKLFMLSCEINLLTCNSSMLTSNLSMLPCNLVMSTYNFVMLTCNCFMFTCNIVILTREISISTWILLTLKSIIVIQKIATKEKLYKQCHRVSKIAKTWLPTFQMQVLYVDMQQKYFEIQRIYVYIQLINVDMWLIYVDMPINYINMQLSLLLKQMIPNFSFFSLIKIGREEKKTVYFLNCLIVYNQFSFTVALLYCLFIYIKVIIIKVIQLLWFVFYICTSTFRI